MTGLRRDTHGPPGELREHRVGCLLAGLKGPALALLPNDRNLPGKGGKALIRSYSPVTTRRAVPADQAVREFGETLSDAVLAGDVGRLFDRCRQDAQERQTSLRILLDTDGPNVSVLPREFTIDPHAHDEYLALRVPIIRSPLLLPKTHPCCLEALCGRSRRCTHNGHWPRQGIANARPLQPLPVPLAAPDQNASLHIRRRDRLGGILHEYQHAA